MSEAHLIRSEVLTTMVHYGQRFTTERITPGAYDNENGTTAEATSIEYGGWGRLGRYADRMIDGTRIRQGDRRATFVPDDCDFVPQEGDVFEAECDGSPFSAVSIQTREVNGVPIAYTMQLRSTGDAR